ncbi:hypothetical protein A5766_15120 [Gordonia sp. 852002-51296_SCH5728562-b]|nr:hypothetical protein A5766_15120 [Gordonia sp. 852002-51296_SCH5728562-b]
MQTLRPEGLSMIPGIAIEGVAARRVAAVVPASQWCTAADVFGKSQLWGTSSMVRMCGLSLACRLAQLRWMMPRCPVLARASAKS